MKEETQVPAADAGRELSEGLGPADDIRDNEHAMIYRWQSCTRLHIAKRFPGCFSGAPDAAWSRRLTDDECDQLLADPWRMFLGPNVF
jgi:hypothetical protein